MNAGSVSTNRPSVRSVTCRSSSRASRSRRRSPPPGWDQASQAESGAKARSLTGPLSDLASSVTWLEATSTSSSLPSRAAAATTVPFGAAARSATQPISPPASLRGDSPGAVPSAGAISSASAPSSSMTQMTWSVSPSTRGSRATGPPITDSARAGPSRWVSQCTVPRTCTALACPVASQHRPSRWSAADIRRAARPEAGEPRMTSSLAGWLSAPRSAIVQMSPAFW